MSTLRIDRVFLGKLGEIASLGPQAGLNQEALTIFEGVIAELPDDVPALTGWALSKIGAGQYDGAIDALRYSVLEADPENQLAKCFLGYALQKNGQVVEGERLLNESLHSNDPVCTDMAKECLGFS